MCLKECLRIYKCFGCFSLASRWLFACIFPSFSLAFLLASQSRFCSFLARVLTRFLLAILLASRLHFRSLLTHFFARFSPAFLLASRSRICSLLVCIFACFLFAFHSLLIRALACFLFAFLLAILSRHFAGFLLVMLLVFRCYKPTL